MVPIHGVFGAQPCAGRAGGRARSGTSRPTFSLFVAFRPLEYYLLLVETTENKNEDGGYPATSRWHVSLSMVGMVEVRPAQGGWCLLSNTNAFADIALGQMTSFRTDSTVSEISRETHKAGPCHGHCSGRRGGNGFRTKFPRADNPQL